MPRFSSLYHHLHPLRILSAFAFSPLATLCCTNFASSLLQPFRLASRTRTPVPRVLLAASAMSTSNPCTLLRSTSSTSVTFSSLPLVHIAPLTALLPLRAPDSLAWSSSKFPAPPRTPLRAALSPSPIWHRLSSSPWTTSLASLVDSFPSLLHSGCRKVRACYPSRTHTRSLHLASSPTHVRFVRPQVRPAPLGDPWMGRPLVAQNVPHLRAYPPHSGRAVV